jgi:N-acetylglucosamine kinase-like BadF-type ATPase
LKLVAGVDGGNTKTIAVVADVEGQARGIGRGGCGNWEGIGETRAAQVITDVVSQALDMAGAKRDDLVHAHMGLAGIDWPEDEPRMAKALDEMSWQCPVTLENDAFLTLRAGSPEGHGIGVTAGTGICAAIVRPEGKKYFYGGFTDFGGGIDTAGYAFQAVVRAEDGRGRATALTEALLEATGFASAWELVHAVHRRRTHIPGVLLNRILFTTAAKGDAVAVEIVTRFGCELALCGTNLIRRYGMGKEALAVVASGSRFVRTGPLLFEVFRREVLAVAPRAHVILSDHPPVMGAVRGALAGSSAEAAAVWEAAKRSVSEAGWLREDMGQTEEGEADAQ